MPDTNPPIGQNSSTLAAAWPWLPHSEPCDKHRCAGELSQPGQSPTRPSSSPSRDDCGADAPHLLRVLVVDDEQLIADTITKILNMNQFYATAVYSGDAALEATQTFCPDIVITDVRMPGRNGIETGILLREMCPHARIVLLSGQAGISEIIKQAEAAGHRFELWPKPIHPRELVARLRAT
jgi:CheY-like chemotaxis protein